jgi:methyltransferase (TIGR00027 family)
MSENQSSKSAEGVAMFRAIETEKPEDSRICYDPIARDLIPHNAAFALSKWVVTSGLYEKMAPGAAAFIAVRERYIDDYLKTELDAGLGQVVILGAGFDTRAYRIAGIEKTRVFELDTPDTQEIKLDRIKKVINPLPAHVTFLPVDFNTQTLAECLQSSGYDEHLKTLFIWQGVTYFLTAEGVDNTLAFIASHSGPGSSVIFDYLYNEIFKDPNNSYAKSLRQAAKISGESYMFGIDRGQIDPFLVQRGFNDVLNVTLEDLKLRYFTGSNTGRVVPKDIAIALARVNKTSN